MNRRVDRATLFATRSDYDLFAELLGWAQREERMEITAWCLMPSHWHLMLRPHDRAHLSRFMHRLETTHAVGFRRATDTRGNGSLYGGRFKSFPVPMERLLRTAVYIERNPVKAALVDRATAWLHGSASTAHLPPTWPHVTRLPHQVERLRPGLLKRPLPEELEREIERWAVPRAHARADLDHGAERAVRRALDAIGRARNMVRG